MRSVPKFRQFSRSLDTNPSRAAVRQYVKDVVGRFHDPDDGDVDEMAEEAYYHFCGYLPFAEVPELFYEVVEEVINESHS